MAERDTDRVRARAYAIWEASGGQHGRDREHWEQAEQEIGTGIATAETAASVDGAPTPEPDRDRPPPTAPAEAASQAVAAGRKRARR